jgi:hypothetical protein
MCGRIYIEASLDELLRNFGFAERGDVGGLDNRFPRYNGVPSQDYPIIVRDIVREPDATGPIFVSARWGFAPSWVKPGGRPPPINARAEGHLDQRHVPQRIPLASMPGADQRLLRMEGHSRHRQEQAAICDRDGRRRIVCARWPSGKPRKTRTPVWRLEPLPSSPARRSR